MRFKVSTDMGGVSRKVNAIVTNRKVRTVASEAAMTLMADSVPKDTGALRMSAKALPTKVTYTAPYAKKVFYWTNPQPHWTTPGTGPLWYLAAERKKDRIAKLVTDYLKRM